jgi:hypothetical protein
MGILPDSLDIFRRPAVESASCHLRDDAGASSAQNVAILAEHHSHHGYQPGKLPFSRCLDRCSTAVSGPRTHRQADQAISVDDGQHWLRRTQSSGAQALLFVGRVDAVELA